MPNKCSSILTQFETPLCVDKTHRHDRTRISQLSRADNIQRRCSEVGFDWPDTVPVIEKIKEELDEVQEAQANPNKGQQDIEEELGDLLFACVNLCRHLKVEPELAITQASDKFIKRFQHIEAHLQSRDLVLQEQSLTTLEDLWVKAKKEN
jgi:ATP diphosphatase